MDVKAIIRLLRNPQDHYHVYKRTVADLIPIFINPHPHNSLSSILNVSSHLSSAVTCDLFPPFSRLICCLFLYDFVQGIRPALRVKACISYNVTH
jgi:hypothetical protein